VWKLHKKHKNQKNFATTKATFRAYCQFLRNGVACVVHLQSLNRDRRGSVIATKYTKEEEKAQNKTFIQVVHHVQNMH